jgi:hypothetical protein
MEYGIHFKIVLPGLELGHSYEYSSCSSLALASLVRDLWHSTLFLILLHEVFIC